MEATYLRGRESTHPAGVGVNSDTTVSDRWLRKCVQVRHAPENMASPLTPSPLHIGNAVTSGGSGRWEICVRRGQSVSSYSRIADQDNWAASSQREPLVSGHFHSIVSKLRSEGRASLRKHYGGTPGTRHWVVSDPFQRLGRIPRLGTSTTYGALSAQFKVRCLIHL